MKSISVMFPVMIFAIIASNQNYICPAEKSEDMFVNKSYWRKDYNFSLL